MSSRATPRGALPSRAALATALLGGLLTLALPTAGAAVTTSTAVAATGTPTTTGVTTTVAATSVVTTSVVTTAAAPATAGLVVTKRGTAFAGAAQVRQVGTSVQGRRIMAYGYGDPAASRVVVVIGQLHGSETAGVPVAKRLAALGARAGTFVWVIPTANPDGFKARTRGNAHGVDLNRNGSDRWSPVARAARYWPGPAAMSEPETQATYAFLDQIDPDLVLIYHQAGNGIDSYRAKNRAVVDRLSRLTRLPVRSFDCAGECTGTLTGWFNSSHRGIAITVELPARVGAAQVDRWARSVRNISRTVPDV
ncbi:MAG: DUF2817 domain-containing protein [Actinomycetota bacterium]|nr:MAG: DUF2817 domain-containing protein [Actinomycetota bacterium]